MGSLKSEQKSVHLALCFQRLAGQWQTVIEWLINWSMDALSNLPHVWQRSKTDCSRGGLGGQSGRVSSQFARSCLQMLPESLYFFLCNLGHFEKTLCITHRFLCCDASVCSRIYTEPSHCDPSQTLFPASCLHPGVSGTLTVTTREAPPPVSAPLGSALCRPVSVSDRVAPHAYISLKSEHAACSPPPPPPPRTLDPIVRAAHYICTLPHPRCANLLSVWMKRAAFFKAPLCWKSHFFFLNPQRCCLYFYVPFIHWISVIFCGLPGFFPPPFNANIQFAGPRTRSRSWIIEALLWINQTHGCGKDDLAQVYGHGWWHHVTGKE